MPNESTSPLTLLLATGNAAKADRLRGLFDGLNIAFESPANISNPPVTEEIGNSHQAIAEEKALAWSQAFDGLVLASDGGLLVPVLGQSWSSLTTRRSFDDDASDAARARLLLDVMRQYTGLSRTVMWVEALALANSGNLVDSLEAEGLTGHLAADYQPAPAGTPGFWVDGLWLHPTTGKRHWELSRNERAAIDDPWEILAPRIRLAVANFAIRA